MDCLIVRPFFKWIYSIAISEPAESSGYFNNLFISARVFLSILLRSLLTIIAGISSKRSAASSVNISSIIALDSVLVKEEINFF